MTGWLGLVVVALAAYRLTRIVTTDTITESPRDRLYHWAWIDPGEPGYDERPSADGIVVGDDGDVPKPRQGGLRTYINELFNCPWCFGVWVSYTLVAVWGWVIRDGIPIIDYLLLGAAVAGVQGFIASRRDA